MSINSVAIAGNLVRDVEVRQTNSGMTVMNMAVAVSERKRSPQTGEWEDSPVFVNHGGTLDEQVAAFEKAIIEDVLQNSKSLREAGAKLGVNASTISRKIKLYNIEY